MNKRMLWFTHARTDLSPLPSLRSSAMTDPKPSDYKSASASVRPRSIMRRVTFDRCSALTVFSIVHFRTTAMAGPMALRRAVPVARDRELLRALPDGMYRDRDQPIDRLRCTGAIDARALRTC